MGYLTGKRRFRGAGTSLLAGIVFLIAASCAGKKPYVSFERDDGAGILKILIDGREALSYRFSRSLDLPHYWPLNSPEGRSLLVQKTEPYPHHRSFWFADTLRLEGEERDVSTYNAFTSGVRTEDEDFRAPFRDRVRHDAFTLLETGPRRGVVEADLVWEMDEGRPVLDEKRRLVLTALGKGEYFLDITFTLRATYGDVHFVSDDVHYAWPYLRLETRWSGEGGGRVTSDSGLSGQEATNMNFALWMDYSNTVEAETAGVAVFQWPDGSPHRWLTREYGCFGPRRPDDRSGRPFTVENGGSLSQRVGVLVHRGGLQAGRVAHRYRLFVEEREMK